jgi:hypothetical protein
VTANYAEPHIYGRHTGLSSLAILVAAAFWTLIWGPVGLALSVPLTVCLVVMGSHVPSLEFLTVMLGDQPVVPPFTCFYQRLLARDQHEASEILETCLKDGSLETIYDSVLIPALILSEKDRQEGDLDESTIDFIRQTARDLIDELGFKDNGDAEPENGIGARASGRTGSSAPKALCIPVRDETDELGSMMLAQLLEKAGMEAVALPVRRADEVLAAVSAENPDVVFLSGMPPFAMARAHRLYRGLRAQNPQRKIMIGIWSYPDDVSRAAQKISRGEEIPIATTLAGALAQARSYFGRAEQPSLALTHEPSAV